MATKACSDTARSNRSAQRRLSSVAAQLSGRRASPLALSPTAAAAEVEGVPAVHHPRRFAATDPVDEQVAFFTKHGYCFVSGALAVRSLSACPRQLSNLLNASVSGTLL